MLLSVSNVGVDLSNTRTTITHAIKMIEEIAGGKKVGNLLEFYPKKIETLKLFLDILNSIKF